MKRRGRVAAEETTQEAASPAATKAPAVQMAPTSPVQAVEASAETVEESTDEDPTKDFDELEAVLADLDI